MGFGDGQRMIFAPFRHGLLMEPGLGSSTLLQEESWAGITGGC